MYNTNNQSSLKNIYQVYFCNMEKKSWIAYKHSFKTLNQFELIQSKSENFCDTIQAFLKRLKCESIQTVKALVLMAKMR
jgi:site-specific recombinase